MRFLSRATALFAAVQGCSALFTFDLHEVHEKRDDQVWAKVSRMRGHETLQMRIGMTQANLDRGEDLLMRVADPKSPKYGQWYTEPQITELFAPTDATVHAVRHWLESSGIDGDRITQSSNKQWLQFDAAVVEVEQLLHTTYHIYKHADADHRGGMGTDDYSIPKSVRPHVDFIVPGIKLRPAEIRSDAKKPPRSAPRPQNLGSRSSTVEPQSLPSRSSSDTQAGHGSHKWNGECDEHVTPECVREVYQIPINDKAAPGNALGIWMGTEDHWSEDQFDGFFSTFQPRIPNGTYPIEKDINGAIGKTNNISEDGVELPMDVMVSWPLIYPQDIVAFYVDDPYWQTAPLSNQGLWNTFLDALDGSYCNWTAFGQTGDGPNDPHYPDPRPGGYKGERMCGVYEPTNVISISAAVSEQDQTVGYQRRQCAEWMKLAMRGITVVEASGDSGVGQRGNQCLADGVFSPSMGCSCPWVLCVGATEMILSTGEERSTTQFPSGAGFSNIFPTPQYQKDAVQGYLDSQDLPFGSYSTAYNRSVGTHGGKFNRNGRAYPDVSGFGWNMPMFAFGHPHPSWGGGTSASAPLWAGIITLINEERLAAGKSTVGFTQPVIYQNPQAFKDITVGNTPGCHTKGFPAAPGWDAATGMGTPHFPALLEAFMCLP